MNYLQNPDRMADSQKVFQAVSIASQYQRTFASTNAERNPPNISSMKPSWGLLQRSMGMLREMMIWCLRQVLEIVFWCVEKMGRMMLWCFIKVGSIVLWCLMMSIAIIKKMVLKAIPIIEELHAKYWKEENVELCVVQTSSVLNDEEGLASTRNRFSSIPASEKLQHIGSWPAWKQSHYPRLRLTKLLTRSWVLKRIPDPTPFMSLRRTKTILAALEFSYKNCIFEGPYWSEHPGSVLYCTRLDRIAKFGCCGLCKSVARTIRSEFSVPSSPSSSREVVIWCANRGALDADEANESVVAKTFQNGGVFLTKGRHIAEPMEMLKKLT